jgi:NitT/TauT family transport system substrate-binding protein
MSGGCPVDVLDSGRPMPEVRTCDRAPGGPQVRHGTTLGRRRFLAAVAALPALPALPALAACTGGSDDADAAGGVSTLRVGVLPIVGAAPLTLAVEQGLFAAGGLTVTTERVQSGAVAPPALIAGDLDVLFGKHVSTIAARSQNLDVMIIAEASRARPDNFAVVTLPARRSSAPPTWWDGPLA